MRRGWREVWDGQQMGGRRHDMDARQVSEVLGTAILLSRVQNLESVERASVGRRLEKEDRAWLVAAGEKKMAADENFGDGLRPRSRPKIFPPPPVTSNLQTHAWSIKCR
jgi:hypothetical protein